MALVEQADLKYEVVVSEKAWIIRLYRWMWGSNARLNFCHIFWGTVIHALVLPTFLRALYKLIVVLDDRVVDPALTRQERKEAKERAYKLSLYLDGKFPYNPYRRRAALHYRSRKAKRAIAATAFGATRPARELWKLATPVRKPLAKGSRKVAPKVQHGMESVLDTVVAGGSRFVMFCQSVDAWYDARPRLRLGLKRTGRITVKLGLGLGALGIAANIGYWGIYIGLVKNAIPALLHVSGKSWLQMGTDFGLAVGIVVGTVTLILLIVLANERGIDKKAAKPAIGSFKLFVLTYRAVKTNTCPRIVIRSPHPSRRLNELSRTAGQQGSE